MPNRCISQLLAMCFAACCQGATPTPDELSLGLDLAPVCGSFLEAAQERFDGDKPMSISEELVSPFHESTLIKAFAERAAPPLEFVPDLTHPDWQWVRWQPLPFRESGYGFGGSPTDVIATSMQLPDEARERLIIRIMTIGWRGPFVQYFMLPAGELAKISMSPRAEEGLENQIEHLVAQGGLTSSFGFQGNLFKHDEGIYQIGNSNNVWQLWPQQREVCRINNVDLPDLPAVRAFHRQVARSFVTDGSNEDHGSMGFRGTLSSRPFYELLTRPWTLRVIAESCKQSACDAERNVDRWFRYFGSSDPWSAREEASLRQGMALAAAEVEPYLTEHFRLNSAESRAYARAIVLQFMQQASGNAPAPDRIDASEQPYRLDFWSLLDEDDRGQLLHATNWFGKTGLMLAAHMNDYDAIEHLLRRKASLSAVTKSPAEDSEEWDGRRITHEGRDALSYAAENASLATVALLVNAGASAETKDSEGIGAAGYLARNRGVQLRGLSGNPLAKLLAEAIVPETTFSCQSVKRPHERMLCGSKGLRLYDAELSLRYKALQSTRVAALLKVDQRRWLKELWAKCQSDELVEQLTCYKVTYRARIRQFDWLLDVLKPLDTEVEMEPAPAI